MKTNLVYFIHLFTKNLFRMPGEACHTLQKTVVSDLSVFINDIQNFNFHLIS